MINWEKIVLNGLSVFLITIGGLTFSGIPEMGTLKAALFSALLAACLATGLEMKKENDEEYENSRLSTGLLLI